MNNKIFFLILTLLFTSNLFSQISSSIERYKEEYPSSIIINVSREADIKIYLEDDEVKITQTLFEEDLFLNESAVQFSKESVSYSSFIQLDKIVASSFKLENGKYIEYKVDDFKIKDELDGAFFDDVKSLNFIYPNLNANSKTKLEIKQTIKNPRFLNAFFFGGYNPVLKSKLRITVDNKIDLDFKYFNTDDINIKTTEEKKRKKTIYTFETVKVKPYEIDRDSPNYKFYYPHIVPIINKYETNSKGTVYLLSNVSDLYGWYYSMVKDINKEEAHPNLKKTVNDLTANKNSEIEKVRSIYYWVQNNIKYIAFEFGLGGFIPRESNLVFNNKYGDCKDNSSILHKMLTLANIEGHLTWVGTRSIPYTYDELPSPAIDNHMILTYENNNNLYYLDATGRYIPLEYPTPFIQGKEVLIGLGENNYKVAEVPVVDGDLNLTHNTAKIFIDDTYLKGSGSKEFSGYTKSDIFYNLEELPSAKREKEYLKELLQLGNNKFSFSNIKEEGKFEYDSNYTINYDFVISDFITKISDEIYINLNLDKKLLSYEVEEYRKTDIEEEYKQKFVFVNELVIPEDYSTEYIPENLTLENEFLKTQIKYEINDSIIKYSHEVEFKYLVLPIAKRKEYQFIFDEVEKAYEELIILKKIK